MNRRTVRMLIRLYPRTWRERYGDEFAELLKSTHGTVGACANVLWSAMVENVMPAQERAMKTSYSFVTVLGRPAAFLPVAMSLTALSVVLASLAVSGIPQRGGDEGAVAHIWQLLMAGQLPIVLFFAIKWLRRAPRQTLGVLAVQAGAVLASMAPVFFLHL